MTEVADSELVTTKEARDFYRLRPDMFIGAVVLGEPTNAFCMNAEGFVYNVPIRYNPGVLQLYMEALCNAVDNAHRTMSHRIDPGIIEINIVGDVFSIQNKGLPFRVEFINANVAFPPLNPLVAVLVEKTGTNFKDANGGSNTGIGRNGIGSTTITSLSEYFRLTCVDAIRNRAMIAEMSYDETVPRIQTNPAFHHTANGWEFEPSTDRYNESVTHIEWRPAERIFGTEWLSTTDQFVDLCRRIAFDCTLGGIRVSFNGLCIEPCANLLTYAQILYNREFANSFEFEHAGTRCVILDGEGQSIAFVNGLRTDKGIHVSALCSAVSGIPCMQKLASEDVAKRTITTNISKHLLFVMYVTGSNPRQESQTKQGLNAINGSNTYNVELPAAFDKKFATWSTYTKLRDILETKQVAKELKNKEFCTVHIAAQRCCKDAVLFLGEGKSTLDYLTKLRDMYPSAERRLIGVMCSQGKPSNTHNMSQLDCLKTPIIGDLIMRIGLDFEKTYTTEAEMATLKYGAVVLCTDPDVDGAHIKMLLCTFFVPRWPSLVQRGFLRDWLIPVIRVFKDKKIVSRFYTEEDFNDTGLTKGQSLKYYKGLGTSGDAELKDDFAWGRVRVITIGEASNVLLDALSSHGAETSALRKKHIIEYSKRWKYIAYGNTVRANSEVEQVDACEVRVRICAHELMPLNYILKHDLVNYYLTALERSLPAADGLKDSIRKLISHALAVKMNEEINLDRFAAGCAERTHYHFGQNNLIKAVRIMAGVYPVSGINWPLIETTSQIGSRMSLSAGGASSRYCNIIITKKLHMMVNPDILSIMPRECADGKDAGYANIMFDLPVILINGCNGVAVGWSVTVPPHHPIQLLDCILQNITGHDATLPLPHWNEFTGTVYWAPLQRKVKRYIDNDNKCEIVEETALGVFSAVGNLTYGPDGIHYITELPPYTSIVDYIEFLEGLIKNGSGVKSFENHSEANKPYFVVHATKTFSPVELRLVYTDSMSNMNFAIDGGVKSFESVGGYIQFYIEKMLTCYAAAKENKLAKLQNKFTSFNNQIRYIKLCIDGIIVFKDLSSEKLDEILTAHDLPLDIVVPDRMKTIDGIRSLEETAAIIAAEYNHLFEQSPSELYAKSLYELREKILCEYPPSDSCTIVVENISHIAGKKKSALIDSTVE